jgi:hypothetical protein
MLVPRVNWMRRLTLGLRELGPYAALGLVLPGGSVILASLWAFRHRRWLLAHAHRTLIIVMVVGAGVVVRGRTLPPSLQSAGGQSPDSWHSAPRNAAFSADRLSFARRTRIFPP